MLNLQYFAEELAEGRDEGREETRPADLNALLAGDKALQSQFDRLVGKALDTARGKWETERHMTADQLAQQKAREREDALDSREAELTRRELRATALGLMSQRGIPSELIDCVSMADEKAMVDSLGRAETAFRAAVNQAVAQRMRGGAPKDAPGDPQAGHLAAMRAAAGLKG